MTTPETHKPALLALRTGLRDARESRKIGLRELARKIGVHPSRLSSWELGATEPTTTTVARILGGLGASGREYDQIMALAEHAGDDNWIDHKALPFIDLLGTYERLSSRVIEWAPFRLPDLLQTPTWPPPDAQPQTERADQQQFHRQVRQQTMNDGKRRYVFMVGDQALSTADGEHHLRTPQPAHIDIRTARSTTTGTIGPFTLFEAGNAPIAVALKHDHCITYLTDDDLLQTYRSTAQALLHKTSAVTVPDRARAS